MLEEQLEGFQTSLVASLKGCDSSKSIADIFQQKLDTLREEMIELVNYRFDEVESRFEEISEEGLKQSMKYQMRELIRRSRECHLTRVSRSRASAEGRRADL